MGSETEMSKTSRYFEKKGCEYETSSGWNPFACGCSLRTVVVLGGLVAFVSWHFRSISEPRETSRLSEIEQVEIEQVETD